MQQQRETEVTHLRDELSALVSRLEQMELDVKKFNVSSQQMEEEITSQKRENKDKEESYTVKKRTLDLLPDAENNIAKLQVNMLHGSLTYSDPTYLDYSLIRTPAWEPIIT